MASQQQQQPPPLSSSFPSGRPEGRGSAHDVRREARRMVQEQMAKRSIARRAAHVAVAEKDLVAQAAARVLTLFGNGLQLDAPSVQAEGSCGRSLALAAKKARRRRPPEKAKNALPRVELLTMKEMAAAARRPECALPEKVQLICTMARVNAEHNRFAAAEKLWRRALTIMRDLLAAEIAFVIRDQKLEAARESSQFSPQKHDEPSPRSRRRNHASKLAAMTNPSPSKRSFREKARAEKSKRIELGVLRRWAREIILEISKLYLGCRLSVPDSEVTMLFEEWMRLNPSLPVPAERKKSEADHDEDNLLDASDRVTFAQSTRQHAWLFNDMVTVLGLLTLSKLYRLKSRLLLDDEAATRALTAAAGSIGRLHDFVVELLEQICEAQQFRDRSWGSFLMRLYVAQQRMDRARSLFIRLEMASREV